jgi:hypothetical protein
MTPEIVYHYFPWTYWEKIKSSGKLIVSEFERKNKIKKPALWFSANTLMEPTAVKMVRDPSGSLRPLTFKEQHELTGIGRISIRYTNELTTWAKYRYLKCTTANEYDSMEKIGIRKEARPSDWYAIFRNVLFREFLLVEKWNGEKWEVYPKPE